MQELFVNKIIGEKIKFLRRQLGLTQAQLSDELSIHPKHLSNIENGRKAITIALLDKLCKIFNKPHVYFFDFVDQETSKDDAYMINYVVHMLKSADKRMKENIIQIISVLVRQ